MLVPSFTAAAACSLQLSSNDTVQDVKQIVYDRQESSYRTSLSAQFEGKKLEDYLDLNSIEGLQNDSVIKFVEGRPGHTLTYTLHSPAQHSLALLNSQYIIGQGHVYRMLLVWEWEVSM